MCKNSDFFACRRSDRSKCGSILKYGLVWPFGVVI